jgi:hypothetical protein
MLFFNNTNIMRCDFEEEPWKIVCCIQKLRNIYLTFDPRFPVYPDSENQIKVGYVGYRFIGFRDRGAQIRYQFKDLTKLNCSIRIFYAFCKQKFKLCHFSSIF